jgi:proline iminopeptidase
MTKKVFRFAVFALLVGIAALLLLVLIPHKYDVPALRERTGTRYWKLPTGSRIAYMLLPAKGVKKSFPVLFLQGGPGGPVYDRNVAQLSQLAEEGFDVYLYDQVGCGLSDRLRNISEYTVGRHKNDLAEIIKLIGSQKVILIGQSWGAMLAAEFVADYPEKVERIIFTSPGPVLPADYSLAGIVPPDSLRLREPSFTNRQGRKKVYTLKTYMVEFCAKTFGLKLASDKEMDDFATILNFEMGKSTVCDTSHAGPVQNGAGYYCMVKTAQSFGQVTDKRDKLLKCRVPVLIMKGQYDNIKWGYTGEYLRLFTDHRFVVIPNAGHAIGIEQPGIYIKTISDFLNE